MTSTASAEAPGGIARAYAGSRVGAQTPAIALVAAGAVVVAALTWNAWGDLSRDTGYDLLAGTRTADGELPYVGYDYYYGPLAPLLLGGVFRLGGAGIAPAIAVGLVLTAAILALTYDVGRRLAGPLGGVLAAGMTLGVAFSADNSSFVLPHSFSASLAVLATLGMLAALGHEAEHGRRDALVIAGLAAGAVALTRPEFAAAVTVAIAGWAGVRTLTPGRDRRSALRDAAALVLPAVLVPAIVYGAVLTRVSPHRLISENLLPVDQLRGGADHVFHLSAPMTKGSVAEVVARLALYAAGTAALVALGRMIDRGGSRGRAARLVAGAVAVGFVLVLAIDPEAVRTRLQAAFGWVPAAAWVAVAVLALRTRAGRPEAAPAAGFRLACALVLAVLATKTYAAFFAFPNAAHPQAAAYALPFAAVLMAWLHLVELPRGHPAVRTLGAGWLALLALAGVTLAVSDASRDTMTVHGPHGALRATAADGPAYQAALETIARETRPGEPILLAPQMTALYVMSGRTDPLRQLSLIPGALVDVAAERRAIRRLDGVRLAITDRRPYDSYGKGAFGGDFDRALGAWLRRDFALIATLRGPRDAGDPQRVLDVWRRR